MIRGVAALALLLALGEVCAADFGSSSEVRAAHPEFFKPAHVSVVTNGGVAYYVYNGRARRLFKNMPPMPLPQLRDAAQLRAEGNLLRFLLKGDSTRTMTLRGSRQIAKEENGDWVTYVFAVPVSNVTFATVTLKSSAVVEAQTNMNCATVGKAKTDDGQDAVLFSLLDHLDRIPHDNSSRAKLSKVMFEQRLYDEAVEQCLMVQDALIPAMRTDAPKEDIESLLSVSELLKECGEYRRARDGYRAVQKLERSEYRGIVLQALSQLQLKLGIE